MLYCSSYKRLCLTADELAEWPMRNILSPMAENWFNEMSRQLTILPNSLIWRIRKTVQLIGCFLVFSTGFLDAQPVAVKMLKTDRAVTPNIVQDFLGEAQKMSNIKHPNVVQLLGVCMDDGPILIVMEFLSRGSLLQYLRDDAGTYVTTGRIFSMLASVRSSRRKFPTNCKSVISITRNSFWNYNYLRLFKWLHLIW